MGHRLIATALIVLLLSLVADAQAGSPGRLADAIAVQARLAASAAGQGAPTIALRRSPTRRCCSSKGALIGFAIGAVGATLVVANTCDSADCGSSYVTSIAILGGLGAIIGAFTAHASHAGPILVRR